MKELSSYLIILNIMIFILCGIDKYQAKENKFRIAEKIFFAISFLGGGIGLLLGTKVFYHKTKKKIFQVISIISILLWLSIFLYVAYDDIRNWNDYDAKHFHITIIKSNWDENQNGSNDFEDILLGAKEEARRHPKYKSAYYDGGYPPDDEVVCTDLV